MKYKDVKLLKSKSEKVIIDEDNTVDLTEKIDTMLLHDSLRLHDRIKNSS